jgi:UDP-N-acetylmuramyl pentapeptide phosphotransferase/UDP-N-acetylglucosamine-1-phosphate transferase
MIYTDTLFYSLFFSLTIYLFILRKELKSIRKYIQQLSDVQHIHRGLVPRLGGFVIFLSLVIFYFLSPQKELRHPLGLILISAIPLWTLALIEDIKGNVLHLYRLAGIFLSICVFIFINDFSWPRLSFVGADFLYAYPFLIKIIFLLVIATIVNGVNFVDGMNGLACISTSISFLCLLILAHRANDILFVQLSLLPLGLLGVFILFNFPFAKIFLGDSGAYLLGFLLATMLIIFYGRHPELSNWGVAVITFYFAFEVIFSFFRKIIQKKSPLNPDNAHLHLLLFNYFIKKYSKKLSNPLTCLSLFIVYLQPIFYISFFSAQKIWMALALIISCLIYLSLYILLYKHREY